MQGLPSFKYSGAPAILLALLALLPLGTAWAEDAGFWQRVLTASGQQGAADFTPPDPVRFGVVMELGDIEQAKAWLDQGLPPDYMADRVGSGLMIGAWEGNLALMELFYSRGADVNLVNSAGEQALLLAAWKGNRQLVDWLLERGAELNRAPGQWSALHYAAFSGHQELVSYLLERGANIDARSPNGSTPLMMAIYDGKPGVAKLLIEKGADKAPRNDWGDGAMEWAMRFNQIGIARLIGSPEAFMVAANQPKESWGQDSRSEKAPADLDKLIQARRQLMAKGLSVEQIDRNIAALRARYAKASVSQEALPPRSTALEITARRADPSRQGARIVQTPSSYKLPPRAPNKLPARR
ncbi:MAG: ankyrin repeat domain-containing protein [Azovibrio sp.]|uniref:ankyrin repeat domain-containing protein n=1 Tax=Azovibrio sp. TaxID=1872673 RepID=UPI003C729576